MAFPALFLAMLVDSLSYALILPVLPFLVLQYGADAQYGGVLMASHALAAAISGPAGGWLSDRLGRRTVILGTLFGTLITSLILTCVHSLAGLLLARVLAGAMAGNVGVIQAAAADQTSGAGNVRAMSLLTLAWALGFVIGPAASAMMPGCTDLALWPGLTAVAACSIACLVVVAMPAPDNAIAHSGTDNETPLAEAWPRAHVMVLIGLVAACQTGLVAMTGFWTHATFDWTQRELSLLFLWVAFAIVAGQAVLLPRLIAMLGERRTLLTSLTAPLLACMAMLAAPVSVTLFVVAAAALFSGIVQVQTLCTTFVSRSASMQTRGMVLGTATSVAAIGRIIGPVLCGMAFTHAGPSSLFWLASAVFALTCTWFAASGPALQRATQ